MRRLNRREYANTLRTLLGADMNVSELPGDTTAPGPEVVFDTVGSNLFMSSNQIEQYLSLGKDALEDAFERYAAAVSTELHVEAEESLPGIQKAIAADFDGYERFHRWAKAVAEAAALDVNQSIVAELSKKKQGGHLSSAESEKITGAPLPKSSVSKESGSSSVVGKVVAGESGVV